VAGTGRWFRAPPSRMGPDLRSCWEGDGRGDGDGDGDGAQESDADAEPPQGSLPYEYPKVEDAPMDLRVDIAVVETEGVLLVTLVSSSVLVVQTEWLSALRRLEREGGAVASSW